MKKLICAKEVEDLIKEGKKVLCIDKDTILTPSAKDAAIAGNIELKMQESCFQESGGGQVCSQDGGQQIDSGIIYAALKVMIEKGMLGNVFANVQGTVPYIEERGSHGFKLIRGNSIRMDVLDTGNPGDSVFYQELIGSADHSSMNAGFMTIEKCNFDWDVTCEEIYYIIEGTLNITIGGKTFVAQPGDSLYASKGSKVTWGSPNKVKVFYATF